MNDRELVITISGVTGTGKTAMIALIQNMLFDNGLCANLVYEPEHPEIEAQLQARDLIEARTKVREGMLTPDFWKKITFRDLTLHNPLVEEDGNV